MKPPTQPSKPRQRLVEWLLLSFALAILGLALLLWYQLESRRVTAAENERMAALSKMLVRDMGNNLVVVNNALVDLVRDRLSRRDGVSLAAATERMRALVNAMPGVRGMVVMDASGTVVASVAPDLLGRNFADRPYFAVPRQGSDASLLYLSPPFRSVRDDVIVSATRRIGGAGRFEGVVSAVLDPAYFSDILQTALYAPDLRVSVRHGGGVFVDVGARGGAGGLQLRASAPVAPAGLRLDHGMTLELRRDLAAVQAPLRQQARAFASMYALLALACAGALAWLQGRRRRFAQVDAQYQRERQQAEALSASEARFRTLIEEAPVAVAMARHGHFIYTNRRYNLLHGYAADEDLTGLCWQDMISAPSLATLGRQLAHLDADDAVEQRFEAIALGKGDTSLPVFKATTRVALSDGPATLIFVQDISAQKRAESHLLEARDAAEAANRSKAEFLANMSHEIRTPLNAILGMAYLLERSNRDRDAGTMLRRIRGAGRSLLGIINDILDVSKIEAGAMVIERNWFALQEVIDSVAATMGVAVGAKPIALLVAPLPAAAAHVLGDALRLEQLLVNLTSNAIKFTEHGSVSLTVQARALPDAQTELLFQVSDTGIGIDAAQQENIFSPFTQADSSTTRRFGGSGLGLTICKQMVELMGGRIGVTSVEGIGSTFWFALCLPVRPAAAAYSSPDMLDLDVLLAEAGDPQLSTLPQTALALGWQLRRAGSGAAVLAEIARRGAAALPDAVILDLQLEGSLVTAQALRAAVPAAACPIVVLISTCQASEIDGGPAQALADALLTKPVTASTLYNAVIEARRKRAAAAAGGAGSPADAAADGAAPGRALSGLRLLVVDDSEINRDVARRILEGEGAQVALAENGRAAIDWLLAHGDAVELVLMDVQMPVMDGIEATRILRTMAQFATLPIVALTAGAFSSHQDAARAAGMDHFIAKPFDVALTLELIARLTAGVARTAMLPLPVSAPAPEPEPMPAPVAAPALAAGIDHALGERTWGSSATFHRYLHKFAGSFGQCAAAIGALAQHDSGAAAATAHKLAGAAANVALPAVRTLAIRAERELTAHGNAVETLAQLTAALAAALDEIAALPPAPADAEAEAEAGAAGKAGAKVEAKVEAKSGAGDDPQDMAAVQVLLERLILALQESTPAPPTQALAALAPYLPSAVLAPISERIDDFDWPGATRLARALSAQLPLHLAR